MSELSVTEAEVNAYLDLLDRGHPLAGSRLRLSNRSLHLVLPGRPVTIAIWAVQALPPSPGRITLTLHVTEPRWLPAAVRQALLRRWLAGRSGLGWLQPVPGTRAAAPRLDVDLTALSAALPFPVTIVGVRLEQGRLLAELTLPVRDKPNDAAGVATEFTPQTAIPPPPAAPAGDATGAADLYARIRLRIEDSVARYAPGPLQNAAPWLLLTPDLSVLLWRLIRDRRVAPGNKAILLSVLLYVLSPIDLVPDVVPVVGVLDDLALVLMALQLLLKDVPPSVIAQHWPGQGDVFQVVTQGLDWLERLLPPRLWRRLSNLLRRRGG